MIAGDDKSSFGADRLLWITGLAPPDSWAVASPSQLPTAPPNPTPQHPAWGNELTPELSDFRLPLTGFPRPRGDSPGTRFRVLEIEQVRGNTHITMVEVD